MRINWKNNTLLSNQNSSAWPETTFWTTYGSIQYIYSRFRSDLDFKRKIVAINGQTRISRLSSAWNYSEWMSFGRTSIDAYAPKIYHNINLHPFPNAYEKEIFSYNSSPVNRLGVWVGNRQVHLQDRTISFNAKRDYNKPDAIKIYANFTGSDVS